MKCPLEVNLLPFKHASQLSSLIGCVLMKQMHGTRAKSI